MHQLLKKSLCLALLLTLQMSIIAEETVPVSKLRVTCSKGKTFIVFDKSSGYKGEYSLYKSDKKITSISSLKPIATLENVSFKNKLCKIAYVIPKFGKLTKKQGLCVITPSKNSKVYYAVAPKEEKSTKIVVGENSLSEAVLEKKSKMNFPFLQNTVKKWGFIEDIYVTWMNRDDWPLDKEDLGSFFTVTHEAKYDKTKLRPIYIYLHSLSAGWGGKPDASYQKGMIGIKFKDHHRCWWRDRAAKRIMAGLRGYLKESKENYDPNRIYLEGESMGGDGAVYHSIVNGDLFAATFVRVPRLLPDVHTKLVTDKQDIPPVFIYWGIKDSPFFNTPGHFAFYKAMTKNHQGYYSQWGNHDHAGSATKEVIAKYNPKTVPPGGMYRFKKNEAYPIFENCSTDNNFGQQGDAKVNNIGSVNLSIDWNSALHSLGVKNETLVDSKKNFSMTFKSSKKCTADLLFRRVQKFSVKAGEKLKFINIDTTGKVIQKGNGTVSKSGLIYLKDITFIPGGNSVTITK